MCRMSATTGSRSAKLPNDRKNRIKQAASSRCEAALSAGSAHVHHIKREDRSMHTWNSCPYLLAKTPSVDLQYVCVPVCLCCPLYDD